MDHQPDNHKLYKTNEPITKTKYTPYDILRHNISIKGKRREEKKQYEKQEETDRRGDERMHAYTAHNTDWVEEGKYLSSAHIFLYLTKK